MLQDLPVSVQVKCLDTLYQFSNWLGHAPWGTQLLKEFRDALPLFRQLAASRDEDVCDYSEMIIENIEEIKQQHAEPGASPNGGPAQSLGKSGVGGESPSVS